MVKVNQIVKTNLLNEVICCEMAFRIFLLEKGLGVLYVDDKEYDFRIGRAYLIPAQSTLKINGYISSGFMFHVDDSMLQNFANDFYFPSNNTKTIDLRWTELRIICNEIRLIGEDIVIQQQDEGMMLLSTVFAFSSRLYMG